MYRDCDHLRDENHIYTIRGNWGDDENIILVKPVYERNSKDVGFTKIVDKRGIDGENLKWINPHLYEHISCKGIDSTKYRGIEVWDKMIMSLINLGIKQEDIGLFGSKRLGFDNCKDEDFIVYGYDNMILLKKHIDEFKRMAGLYNHTMTHARYQANTHGKYFAEEKNDLLMCLLRKWSTCAFTDKLTSTIRFVNESDNTGKILKKYFYDTDLSNTVSIRGYVSSAEGTSFMPRHFVLNTEFGKIDVITPLWIFHQCVRDNDLVEVTGCLIDNSLLVRRYNHGIKFI